MDERWETCNFNDQYEISSLGNVRRKNGKVLKATKTARGYCYVNLSKKSYSVHKLVAYAFLPPCPGVHGLGRGKYHIDHIDGDKSNNQCTNLQWLLHEENVRDGTQRAFWSRVNKRRALQARKAELELKYTAASLEQANTIIERIDLVEKRLALLLDIISLERSKEGELWLDSKAFCRAVGIKDKASLHYYMSKGIIHGPAIKNIGTAKRPRYRFHRTKAVDQFLNRAAKVS